MLYLVSNDCIGRTEKASHVLGAPLSQLPSRDFYERHAKSGYSVLLGGRFD